MLDVDLEPSENTWKFGRRKKAGQSSPEEEGWCVSVGRPIREASSFQEPRLQRYWIGRILDRKKKRNDRVGRTTATPTINKPRRYICISRGIQLLGIFEDPPFRWLIPVGNSYEPLVARVVDIRFETQLEQESIRPTLSFAFAPNKIAFISKFSSLRKRERANCFVSKTVAFEN